MQIKLEYWKWITKKDSLLLLVHFSAFLEIHFQYFSLIRITIL